MQAIKHSNKPSKNSWILAGYLPVLAFSSPVIDKGKVDLLQVGIAATGSALAAAAALPLGTSALEIFSGNVVGSQFGLAAGVVNTIRQRSLKP